MKPLRALAAAACVLALSCGSFPLPDVLQAQSASIPASIPLAGDRPAQARHAMVVTEQRDATDAGVRILKEGGNAVDAAVAVGFTLAVVYPYAGNLGGGGFMLLRLADGETHVLDFREEAPLRATANMFLDASGNPIPEASTAGYRSIGVPGTVAGLAEAERRFGRLTLRQVMAPAIHLANDGYILSGEEAALLRDPVLARWPESRRIFERNGDYYRAGERFRQPELAHTLMRIAANPDGFYHGALARELSRALQKHGGLIREKDLAAYRVKDRRPLTGSYRGYRILAPPPPSSGGVALVEILNILEGYDLSKLGDRSPKQMHLIAEAFRRAFMDRAAFLGDPDFSSVPTAALIDKRYAAAWRKGIDPARATPSSLLKRPPGFLPKQSESPMKTAPESTETTHFTVLDQAGDAVAVTYTLNNGFGSGVTADGLGFLLNDEMDDFTVKPGAPNMYGLVQSAANAIAPGKRPLSSMMPAIVLDHNKIRFILGSPGGPRIISTVANILISSIDDGLNIQQAVDAPRFHHQYLPDTLFLEPGFPAATVQALAAMGYNIENGEGKNGGVWSDGECIAVDPETGMIYGGHDHRRNFGKAAGY